MAPGAPEAATCPFGRASLCFPLAVPAKAALAALAAAESEGSSPTDAAAAAEVSGYTTGKTRAAGADSLRVLLLADAPVAPGAHLVTLRAPGQTGWLVGLAGTRQARPDASPDGLEVLVLARPDARFQKVMYLPEATLQDLFPLGSSVPVRFLRPLLPTQHDCPEQWLRDRLLRLANMVEEMYSSQPETAGHELQVTLERAGLRFVDAADAAAARQKTPLAPPADSGDRVSEEELGYWNEEMKWNTRCGASMNGESRLDYFMSHMPG
eukprot:TRINITY_DN69374_c0_g1_i1.p1 TRINITY_DN69374_c0_g1~~TRINITY_DN69374_c0_g1_i1.p1  ORF type:complete len:267 (+),score=62.69 TRINITY_DN69374_c0_g1_i1:52-852(+)